MTVRPITLPDVLEQMADSVPDREAVVLADRSYTYREIDERASRLANHLLSLGVQPGDRVAVHAMNCIEWVDAFFGVMKARAVPINVNYRYEHDELMHVYRDSGARHVLVAPDHADAVERVRAELPELAEPLVIGEAYDAAMAAASPERPRLDRSPDDLYILYTGGTTGSPKGVMWRQEDIIRAALNMQRYNAPFDTVEQLGQEAAAVEAPLRMVTAGPLMHGGSQWILGNAAVAGATFVMYTGHFDPERYLDLTAASKANALVFLGDAMARPVTEAVAANPGRWDLSSVYAVSNGAAPLSEAVRAQIRTQFPQCMINDSYGSSESGAAGTKLDDGSARSAPQFQVGPDVMVVRGHDRTPCDAGEVGLLARSGPIPLGYLNDPEKTAQTFFEIDGRRWVIPGDAAVLEEDGVITLLGRGSVTINTGGEKVHPEEVEGVLLGHPEVADAAVVGVPHPRWGEQVTAMVELRPGAATSADDIRAHCRGRIADFKIPKEVLVVPAVPRTAVSKVDYRASKALAVELLDARSATA